ncbi:helix-turn-helix domain-containing protein [Ancylobacter sp. 6x-1]|uniref:Helix-turn-helix domain-containing protein n=1 Tax=Ancylobacter crimeensis TaxID=2579147 RepID=A0ABT0DBZ6_9HYPH|nr:helix-turn-helix domain-containing protein [Ancylobacter crimeensis]MCK0197485.1 helix-turn-helix domain-containing protein [Ancylobacter crimeensis]
MTPFGRRMRELRAERGVTLKEMAAELGVSAAYLSALEHGKRGQPSFMMLQRIMAYFNVIWDEAESLRTLAELSDPRVVVDTAGLTPEATELANLLAQEIATLPQEAIAELLGRLKILSRPGGH